MHFFQAGSGERYNLAEPWTNRLSHSDGWLSPIAFSQPCSQVKRPSFGHSTEASSQHGAALGRTQARNRSIPPGPAAPAPDRAASGASAERPP